jgi:hypothetical protein
MDRKTKHDLDKMIRLTERMGLNKTCQLFENYAEEEEITEEKDHDCKAVHPDQSHEEWEKSQEPMSEGEKKPDGDGDGVPPWADKDDKDPEVQEESKKINLKGLTKEQLTEAFKNIIRKKIKERSRS